MIVALANLPAWVEDGGEQRVEVSSLVGGEIGPDVAALVEQLVTGGAALEVRSRPRYGLPVRPSTTERTRAISAAVPLPAG